MDQRSRTQLGSRALSTHPPGPAAGQVVVLGVPFDANSSYRRGSAAAPEALREALTSGASNLTSELGVDLEECHSNGLWTDLGDLAFDDEQSETAGAQQPPPAFPLIETAVSRILRQRAAPLLLGGDHSITYPALRAVARHHDEITLLHFDAHPDLYDVLDGNRYSHACPFARLLEEECVDRLVQVGIRTFNEHQRQQAQRFDVEAIEMSQLSQGLSFTLDGPLYVSIDIDVLDPAFAPGVSHQEPGGFSTRELIDMIHTLPGPIVGADLVELNPAVDTGTQTSVLAAKVFKELLAQMLIGRHGGSADEEE